MINRIRKAKSPADSVSSLWSIAPRRVEVSERRRALWFDWACLVPSRPRRIPVPGRTARTARSHASPISVKVLTKNLGGWSRFCPSPHFIFPLMKKNKLFSSELGVVTTASGSAGILPAAPPSLRSVHTSHYSHPPISLSIGQPFQQPYASEHKKSALPCGSALSKS